MYLSSQHIPAPKEGKWNVRFVKRILENRYTHTPGNQPILAYGYLQVLDENGQPYTEASVAQIVYELEDHDMSKKKIADILNKRGIPTGLEAYWLPGTVSLLLEDDSAVGNAVAYRYRTIKEPGGKRYVEKTPKDEWIHLPEGTIPPILVREDEKPDIALYERVQTRLAQNQKGSSRNNQKPDDYLLRGGFIKCGYCGGNMIATSIGRDSRGEQRKAYRCSTNIAQDGRCKRWNCVYASTVHERAWSKALEIIQDPSQVDAKLEARRTADPNAEKRQYITDELVKIKAKQQRLRDRLEDEDLDDDTYADIKLRLKELAKIKSGYEQELKAEVNIHTEWIKTQEQLSDFHKRCQEMRERLDDPEFEPDYKFKRDAIEFFGIVARVWAGNYKPKIEIELYAPSIVSNTASDTLHQLYRRNYGLLRSFLQVQARQPGPWDR